MKKIIVMVAFAISSSIYLDAMTSDHAYVQRQLLLLNAKLANAKNKQNLMTYYEIPELQDLTYDYGGGMPDTWRVTMTSQKHTNSSSAFRIKCIESDDIVHKIIIIDRLFENMPIEIQTVDRLYKKPATSVLSIGYTTSFTVSNTQYFFKWELAPEDRTIARYTCCNPIDFSYDSENNLALVCTWYRSIKNINCLKFLWTLCSVNKVEKKTDNKVENFFALRRLGVVQAPDDVAYCMLIAGKFMFLLKNGSIVKMSLEERPDYRGIQYTDVIIYCRQ